MEPVVFFFFGGGVETMLNIYIYILVNFEGIVYCLVWYNLILDSFVFFPLAFSFDLTCIRYKPLVFE